MKMAGLESILVGLGGKVLPKLVSAKFGPEMGDLTKVALEALAEAFGVSPEPAVIEKRITEVEAADRGGAANAVAYAEATVAPRLLAYAEVLRAANEQQRMTDDLLSAQVKQGGPASDWLWLWQYFLMAAWAWSLAVVHLINAGIRALGGTVLPAPDLTILMTLTAAYLGLHMGGHTVLELMRGGAIGKAKGGAE